MSFPGVIGDYILSFIPACSANIKDTVGKNIYCLLSCDNYDQLKVTVGQSLDHKAGRHGVIPLGRCDPVLPQESLLQLG